MIMISFKNKEDKEDLLKKAKKMEEYASMIVDCIEDSDYDRETKYRKHHDEDDMYEMNDRMMGRYGYRRGM